MKRALPSQLFLALLGVSLLLISAAGATRPRAWTQASFSDFAAGTPDGLTIAADGSLSLGQSRRVVAEVTAQRIWSLLAHPQHGLFVGTGDEGLIYCVNHAGAVVWSFDSPELSIHSLVMGGDGMLYAGTAPDGLIYRIDPSSGEAKTAVRTGASYVWDLMLDGDGRLCAATGDPGQVLRVDPGGTTRVLFTAPDEHVMCIAPLGNDLVVGTSGEARIYALSQGADSVDVRLLFDAPQAEIHDLVVRADGSVLASALPSGETTEGTPVPAVLYVLRPDGAVQQLWQADDAAALSLVATGLGAAAVVSDKPARVSRVSADGHEQILLDLDETTMAAAHGQGDGSLILGAAQSGRIIAVGPGFASSGQFVSAVEDFGGHASWGQISWDADVPRGARIQVNTRTGNTSEPDDTWSSWSDALSRSGQPIPSPAARYLQYRLDLRAPDRKHSPTVRQLTLYGQQTNLPPTISALQVERYSARQRNGNSSQDPALAAIQKASERSRPPQARSLFLVHWQAADPNGDELKYSLYLRGEGQSAWKLGEDELTQTSVLWDTFTMPEGTTTIMLVASDAPANPPAQALEARRTSTPFALDNSPPAIRLEEETRGAAVYVRAQFEDRISAVARAEYSVDYDSDGTTQVAPADGLFDSKTEHSDFVVGDLSPGEHIIVVRAWDQADNVGVRQIVVRVE